MFEVRQVWQFEIEHKLVAELQYLPESFKMKPVLQVEQRREFYM